MLLFSTTLQPPRRYPHAPSNSGTAPPITPSSQYQHASAFSDTSSFCSKCKSDVWNVRLFQGLKDLPREQGNFCKSYEIETKVLREGVLERCEWCGKLADGINGFVFLDAVYKEWGGTDSWPGSGSEADDVGGDEDGGSKDPNTEWESGSEPEELKDNGEEMDNEGVVNDHEEYDDEYETNREAARENLTSPHIGTFDEEKLETDSTGGWHSYTDGDILAFDANLGISLSFTRDKAGQFTFLNVRIELCGNEETGNVLKNALRSNSVELRWRVNITATLDASTDSEYSELFSTQLQETNLGSVSNMRHIGDWSRERIGLVGSTTLDWTRADSIHIPSRLIEVGTEALRVVKTANIPHYAFAGGIPQYAALSYVWGQNQTCILLESTKELLTSSFSISHLPKTIQDALTVTRAIGLRYLWVDALCIVQDSNEDKAMELPKMRNIYQSAAITLVASIAKSANEGFLHHVAEPDYLIPPISIPIPSSGSSQSQRSNGLSMVLSYPSSYMRHKDPINARAWTFQELLLSPRCILFTYRGLEFIDRGRIPAADGLTSGRDPQIPNLPWSGPMFSLTNIKAADIRTVWLTVRGEYSRRKLSYEGDKLVAIAAVAEEVGKVYTGRYLAGLWEKDLLRELKWCRGNAYTEGDALDTMKSKPRAEGYVAPTWSWASVRNPIDDYAFDEHQDSEYVTNSLGFTVVSCEVESVIPGFAYGAVKSGILTVSGRVHSFFWRPEKNPIQAQSDGFLAIRAEDGSSEYQVGEAVVDASDLGLVDGCVVDCIAMGLEERIPGKKEVEGLMLLPIDDETYQRVGFCRIWVTELFEECEVIQVSIL